MTVADLRQKYSGYAPGILGASEHYAVLVPLVEREGVPYLLFEVRAKSLRRQPGEVCFPGGKQEEGEDSVACAVRETGEELGIPSANIHPIALLDQIHSQAGFVMHPVLAQVDESAVAAMRPNGDEVEEPFLVPLSFFEENAPLVYTYPLKPEVGEDFPYELINQRDYDWKSGAVEVPIYRYEGRAIWGMTGRIIRALTL
ncbi:MAG: CoA pyrophosphatase [Clostridia bacterium]|nr:CoA pyrophosphatase [Clostridia bacterium]